MSEFGFQSFLEVRSISSFAKPEDLDIRSTVMQAHQKNHGVDLAKPSYSLVSRLEAADDYGRAKPPELLGDAIGAARIVVGKYDARVAYGQDGVQVIWNRLIFPDASSVDTGSPPHPRRQP